MPAVSILMPCYNAAETLPEALESLSRQTLSDFEVIALDDGSGDATLATLESWAGRDSRFRAFACPHGGILPTLNAGLALCRAPLIARMDADDRAHPERLARQAAYLHAHPEIALVSCRVTVFPAEAVRQGFRIYLDWLNALLSDEDIRREIFIESPLPHPSVMLRKEWLERVGGYEEHGWPEDYDLWLRLYLAGARFAKLPEALLDWRERPERLTRSDSRYSVENFLRAKAHYLARGPLQGRAAVFIWGAGMMGRRLCKHLQHQNVPLAAFVDIDPKKIGHTRRGLPVIAPAELPAWWARSPAPALLAAVGARGARQLIRARLSEMGLAEGVDWWGAA
jgi:glycosyltransferase involved in cell wall biosynthesis